MLAKEKNERKPRQQAKFDVAEVKKQASGKWLEILSELAPDLEEAVENAGKHVPCPIHDGDDGFRLFDDAAETGGGICNTCGAFSDGFALIQWITKRSFPEVLSAVAEYLEVPPLKGKVLPFKPVKQLAEPDPDMDILAGLNATLDQSRPGHPRITAYLRHRGLSIDPPDVLRLSESEKYFQDGHIGAYPAIVAAVCKPHGKLTTLLRIYLAADGDGKAPVDPAKKLCTPIFKGATKGCAIQLYEPGKVLGIAEGVETALAVHEATGIPVWSAISAGGMAAVEIPEGVETVEVWADNDSNGAGQKAAKELAKRLIQEGFAVQILLPSVADKDWLDVLVEQGKEAFDVAKASATIFDPRDPAVQSRWRETFAEEKAAPVESLISVMVKELNKRHFVVQAGSKIHVATEKVDPETGRPDFTLGGAYDLKLRYFNRTMIDADGREKCIADIWLRHPDRREHEGIKFAPGQDFPGYYNLFHGFSQEPQEGDCSLYWDHVQNVICGGNEEHYRYVRKWMAHMVQKPGEAPGVAIVVVGKQGTGKGVFVEELGSLIGLHYSVLYRLEQITGRFNHHLKSVILLYANEAVTTGDKAAEGVIKGLVTDPTLPIEQKFVDVVQVKNCLRLIVTSNDERPVPIGMDDRRFLVLQASDAYKENKAYFGKLIRQMENGGRAALMHDLLNEDLTNFDVRTAPKSRYSFDIKIRGAEPIVRWWFERLVDGTTVGSSGFDQATEWNTVVPRDALHKDFLSYCTTHRLTTIDKAVFGKRLTDLMPGVVLGETRPTMRIATEPGGARVERRVWCYNLPTLEQCREAFQRFSKSGAEIWPVVNDNQYNTERGTEDGHNE